MILEDQLRLKLLEVTNAEDYRLMLRDEEDALYPPWFFTWVDKKLTAFAWPQTRGNLEYLWQIGMRHIITLCPEKIPNIDESKFSWTYIPIEECTAPSIDQIFKFIRTVQMCRKHELPVGIHDRMGLGRSGVMVSIYLMYFHRMTADQAIKNLRYHRPGSLDSAVQEECVLNYRPNAKEANDNRLKRMMKNSNHFLSILQGEDRQGIWGLPKAEYAINK
ncbi:dual specificity protein phosphatase 23-like [Diabrotica virgifera virgifera]|uniref:Tyrosine specific protein phosphatases domain-containing protein n=1 Tax=Diabrotica virgifera virgifera TaxID=50390 RepID=A0ABM5IIV9_DIAVI|nr:dual specificity protein phosphatase 23-like [Diabrotica virgifera virgifera]